MKTIENKSFDAERAFYGSHELTVRHCTFDGPADGESAFKECSDIFAEECFFNLRYPFWHVHGLKIAGSEMTELCRIIGTQPLCYCKNLKLIDCEMVDTDLAFEKSEVEATILTPVISIKNPRSGKICVPSVSEVIRDEAAANGEVIVCGNQSEKAST